MRLTAWISLVVLFAAGSLVNGAPLSYTGGTYTQNFNGLPTSDGFFPPSKVITGRGPFDMNMPADPNMPTTGMEGWTMSNHSGSSANTEYRAHAGELAGATGRGVLSFGLDNDSDRALGILATSAAISRFGLSLVNNTSGPLTQLDIEFTGEQWRRGNVPTPGNALQFAYAITSNAAHNINTGDPTADPGGPAIFAGVSELSFASPNLQATPTEVAINGNLPLNQVSRSHSITGINWGVGQTLMLRWTGQDISGQDDGVAIDNLSFSASQVIIPEPAAALLAGFAGCGLFAMRRWRER